MFNEHLSLLFVFLSFFVCLFFSSSVVSPGWIFPIETMDGVLRLILCFGIFTAKFITIAMQTPVFFLIQSSKRAAERGTPYLPWERQEQPGCSFVWSSCGNAQSPMRGPGGPSMP